MGFFRPALFLWALPAAIPLIYLVARLYKCAFWVLTEGRIEEVRLNAYDDSGEAATSAHVTWVTGDGTPQTGELTVSHWEGEADEESQKLWQEHAAEYTGRLVQIFHSPKNPQKYIGYLEDSRAD